MPKFGINGFGRIGRNVLRALRQSQVVGTCLFGASHQSALTSRVEHMATAKAPKTRSDVLSMNPINPFRKPVSPAVKRLQLGVLGRFFGDKKNAPSNIAGVLAFLLFGLLVAVTFWPVAALSPGMVCSLLTLTLGYLFGKSQR